MGATLLIELSCPRRACLLCQIGLKLPVATNRTLSDRPPALTSPAGPGEALVEL